MPAQPRVERLLRHIASRQEVAEGFAVRYFNVLHAPKSTPENNWGMPEDETPDWIHQVKGIHKGKRTFIFGTGPSLIPQLPLLGAMKDEDTWTVNRMRHWYAKGDLPFIPTHHLIAEPGPCTQWGRTVQSPYCFPEAQNQIAINWWRVDAPGWMWCPKAPDDVQMRWHGFQGLGDTFAPLCTGWASPLTSSQLAFWMGYEEVYFLGIDTTQTGQAWDPVHGRTLYERNIRSILENFDRARMDVHKAGKKIFDCTPGGRINNEGILEYRDLEEVLCG